MKLPEWFNQTYLNGSEFDFGSPNLLWLLLLLPLLAFLKGRRGGYPSVIFSSVTVLSQVGRTIKNRSGRWLASLFYIGVTLLIIALARPRAGKSTTHTEASGIDIMLAIDVSRSMLAEDYIIGNERASRVETVLKVAKSFIEKRPSDRLGIIAFAGRPYTLCPPTLDHDRLIERLGRIKIGLVEDGTAIGSGISSAISRLVKLNSKSRILILLTDGANNAGQISPLTAAEAAKAVGVKIYTIGAGHSGPVPYPVETIFGRQYQMAQFDSDPETLKKIATMTGGAFYEAQDTETMKDVFSQIDRLEKTEFDLKQYHQYRDLFPYFVSAGLTCLLAHFIVIQILKRRLP